MNSQSQTVDDETLVAYLDGELETERAALVEQTVASDASLRQRLEKLRATWDLLDDLPEIVPGRDLTQTTIQLIAQQSDAPASGLLPFIFRNTALIYLIAVLSALAAGAALALARSSFERTQFLSDLALLDNYRQLSTIDSPAWLQKLATLESMREAMSSRYFPLDTKGPPISESAKLEWLKQLDGQRRARLIDNMAKFNQELPARRETLRTLGDMLTQPVDGGSNETVDYRAIVSTYFSIVERLGSAERMKLFAKKDLDQRAEEFNDLVNRELAIAYAKRISVEDEQAMRSWLNDLQAWGFSLRVESDVEIVHQIALPTNESDISDDDIQRLVRLLSPHAQGLLDNLEEQHLRLTVGLWLMHVVVPSAEELMQRLNGLPLDRQSELEFLSEDQARRRLSD